ncbi:MAG TPA: adenosylcobalamin-dependent ribonucleoside-diphosphate reductase [Desulfitobacterium dehalogenans]|uniref:Vitamin B12-dependent ribonucleotide reductase n=1 Tax=Desulfitobacterium dehalogenans TaxID=36854 RepID=A0A7C6Z7D7_9FIRM|nr:adenosylcobalamin-dependent ribonucleoside-diphosphate reductase [Desulfitobacterium dehalogenans]
MKVEHWIDSKLGQDSWCGKYQFEGETFEQWLNRVSNRNKEIKQLIISKRFLFGGRILANRGLHKLGRKVCYSNCFVVESPEDSIESIFDCAKKMAKTYSYGGGVGVDISKLSPKGAKVNNAANETSGSVSFMDLYSKVTELIGQNGRRGALMISIDCRHPDLLEFIDIKNDLDKVTKANISIKITGDFMQAVKENREWELEFTRKETGEVIKKIVNAKEVFYKIAENNWKMAEPGLLFWDRIEDYSLLSEDGDLQYLVVNPCTEERLPSGGSCLLGSINLSELVINPFTDYAVFDLKALVDIVRKATVALNEVLDEGLFLLPILEQFENAENWRQIGIGVMGLADMLIKLGIRYGSKESIELCDIIGFTIADTAINESALLACKYGTYPMYSSSVLESSLLKNNTTKHTYELVSKYGLRNSQLLTIAPTDSLSSMLGISGGIEPIFNISYTLKTESLHDKEYYKISTPIVEQYMKLYNITDEKELPDYFVTALTLNYKDRIDMQSVWQKHIDASISSTVNVPEDFTVEEVMDLYLYAWERGLKGVTIYRDNCMRSGILTNTKETLPWGTTIQASEDLIGRKTKIMSGCGSVHVQAWFDPSDGRLTELFLSKGSEGICNSWLTSNSRIISAALRTGLGFDYLIDLLKSAPTCPSYVVRSATKRDTSRGSSCLVVVANALTDMQKDFLNFR